MENILSLHERLELRFLEPIEEQDNLMQRGVAVDLEIVVSIEVDKDILTPAFMKIEKSNVQSVRV